MKNLEAAVDAYVAMGSNLDPTIHVLEAGARLKRFVDVVDVSTLYRSLPKGRPEQPSFVNGVFHIRAAVSPLDLKYHILRKIEADLGRVRDADKCASRTMDLDLVLYGDEVAHGDELILPDPDIYRYNHVAVPLLEVAPRLVLPDQKRALSTLDSAKRLDGLSPLPDLTAQLKGIIEHGRKTRQ